MSFALLALGCAQRVQLPDAPIEGGTREQRDVVREELDLFDQNVGPGRLRISGVRFTSSLPEHVAGRFVDRVDGIRIAADTPLDELREIVRHELCHALDDAERLMAEPHSAFDQLGAHVFDDPDHRTARARRGEALAVVCELGATRAHALAEPCPGDAPLASELYGWAAREVWTAFEPEIELAPLDEPYAEWDAGRSGSGLWTSSTDAPDVLVVDVNQGDFGSTTWVDLETGEPRPPADPVVAPDHGGTAWGYEDGPMIALLWSVLPTHAGTVDHRVMATIDGPWGQVPDLCVGTDTWSFFFARDLPWIAWMDGTTVAWAPVSKR